MVAITLFTACKPKDAELKTNVDTAVENDKVNVDVNDGVVTLSGEVTTPASREKAELQARRVKGVQTVNNEIKLPPPPPPAPAPPTAGELADQKLYNEVQAVIAIFPDVRASVHEGVVTLSGRITRTGQILLIPKIAGLFPKKIDNRLKIK